MTSSRSKAASAGRAMNQQAAYERLIRPRSSSAADVIAQLKSLPARADAVLPEQWVDGRRLLGYRVRGSQMPGAHGVEFLDLWLDATSGAPDHADITPSGAGSPGYQMHIKGIRLDAAVDAERFEMTPPAGYVEATPEGASKAGVRGSGGSSEPAIVAAPGQSAVVLPMQGPYTQAAGALDRVARELDARGVVRTGPPFGRFESEARWQVGFPVSQGADVQSPFELIELPAGQVASLTVTGPWGESPGKRWSSLMAWVSAHGYVVMGPPMEVWSGPEADPAAQVTELRVAVASARPE